MKKIKLTAVVPFFHFLGQRLDKILAEIFQEYSRSFLKNLILMNQVHVNHKIENNPDKKLLGGELVVIFLKHKNAVVNTPEKISLNVVYEDNDILVINKPSNMIVHPGSGNDSGTILNALLYRYKNIDNVLPRAGIVHRLDKNTTGLMVIAKNIFSYNYLTQLLKNREITRKYQGVVVGNMISGGTINSPIKRNPIKRNCMMIHPLGKKSITHYKIIKKFKNHTHISIQIETGRTHQIRVHMLYIRHPLVGDKQYKGAFSNVHIGKNEYADEINQFPRQALHAGYLAFLHPVTKSFVSWSVSLPQDMKNLLLYL